MSNYPLFSLWHWAQLNLAVTFFLEYYDKEQKNAAENYHAELTVSLYANLRVW